MRNLLVAGCVFALAALSSCSNEATVSDEPTKPVAQPIILTTDSTGLVQKQTAKGVSVQLEGRFHNAVVVHRHADGTLSTACTDDHGQAEAFMAGPKAPTTQLEVK